MKKILLYVLPIVSLILFSLNSDSSARKSPDMYDGRLRWLFAEGDLDYYIDMDLTTGGGGEDIKAWIQIEQIYYKGKYIATTHRNFHWDKNLNKPCIGGGGIAIINDSETLKHFKAGWKKLFGFDYPNNFTVEEKNLKKSNSEKFLQHPQTRKLYGDGLPLTLLFYEDDIAYYLDDQTTKILTDTEFQKKWWQRVYIYYKDKVIAETLYKFYWDGKFNASLWNDGGIIPIQSAPVIFDGGVDIDYTLHNDPRIIEIFKTSWQKIFGYPYSVHLHEELVKNLPEKDIEVLTWRGITYSVKADTLKYHFNKLSDIDYFSCYISADNNSPQNFYFQKQDGKLEVRIRSQYNAKFDPEFAEALYKKICDSVIRTTWQEKFPKSYAVKKSAEN